MQADTIKRLRALSAEIGPEQWEAIGWHVRTTFNGSGGWLIADCSGVTITSGNTVAMFIAALNNALPELLAIAEASEWQPIDSAPKDGTHVWLGNASNLRIAFWHYPADGWIDHSLAENGSQRTVHFTPTHWMPLPKPPTVRLVRVVGEE